MTPDKFVLFSAALKTAFPWANMFPNDAAMELWYLKLKDIPDDVASAVLDKWLETREKPPSIAAIRAEASIVMNGVQPTWADGWEQVRKAIGKYGYMRGEEALASMDELTSATVKRLGWQQVCESENVDTLRANFRMVFETMARRQKEDWLLSEHTQETLAEIQERSGDITVGLISELSDKLSFEENGNER